MGNRCENCIVRQLNSLKVLGKEELKAISDHKITRKFKKGESLFSEGEKLNGIFCVRSGVTKLSKISENGKGQIVKIASKGEMIGQRSIISEEQTNLSAVALDDMEVCFIPKEHIMKNLSSNVEFTKTLLKHMANDLKHADTLIVNMAQKTVKQRVAETLSYLDTNFERDLDGFIGVILTREDIANLVGTAKEACIRTLTSLRKDNIISTQGKRIKIEDKKALYNIIQGI
ncbi:Crp/Fnr family transcriptional regulator [Mesonia ostreae]|uniref:Crp/Fnr family transcriptional regulator n=1 Tax=Mesonia ostreae TaxID=861110 RepID=A0ABU2KFW4_9FLAO|nr:Crp/Fnr family transcriptional regulator [Mesonia ostreae]MDT0293605.1 Crp/Fnr family transcriptional regulator [Mesonia ostreae]